MPHLFFSYFNFKICEFGIYNTQIKFFLMVSLLFFDSEQLLIYKQTQENASKYPKLACAKITILHPADLKTKTLWIQVSYRYLRTSSRGEGMINNLKVKYKI